VNDKAIETQPYIDDAENVKALVEEVCSPDGPFPTLFVNILREWSTTKMVSLRDMLADRTPPKPVPESDTRGEVTAERPKLHILFEGMARVYDHTEADELFASLESSNLLLREENERLRTELTDMTVDRNLWASDHEDDCPNKTLLEAAEAELATLRASASCEGWIEIKEGGRLPTGEDHLLIVHGPEESKMQCVGYWNRLMKTWVVDGQRMDGLCVIYYKPLDWPTATNTEKSPLTEGE